MAQYGEKEIKAHIKSGEFYPIYLICGDEDYLKKNCRFNENASLTITDKLDDELFRRLDEGEDVMLIYRTDWCRHLLHKGMEAPKYSFRHTWERYKGVIWDRGTINGGPDKAELLKKHGFVTDGEINYQYYQRIYYMNQ